MSPGYPSESSSATRLSSASSPPASLRALELEQGPASAGSPLALRRTATLQSISGFEFEHALLPLSLSGDEPLQDGEHKHVGLLHGEPAAPD